MEDMAMQFLLEKTMILVPVLWGIGWCIKQTPRVPDWLIPSLLLVIGVGLGYVYLDQDLNSGLQGFLAAMIAGFTHQLFKQTKEREGEGVIE